MQWRPTSCLFLRIWIRTVLQEHLHEAHVTRLRGEMKSSLTAQVASLDVERVHGTDRQ
jgi:hypothetical protein